MFHVYIVRCIDGSLYTGYARDPEERVAVHNSRKGAKYTASRVPVVLVYREPCDTRGQALTRERQIKDWPRRKKDALVAEQATRDWEQAGASAPADEAEHRPARRKTAATCRS